MFFSKSFGYALRGVLYIAATDKKSRVCIEELADKLKVPRHFMGKVMKTMVKNGILNSSKGPTGGFSLNDKTLNTPVLRVLEITDGQRQFDTCILRFSKCNTQNPCPLHHTIQETRKELSDNLSNTTISDLLKAGSVETIRALVEEG